MFGRAAEVAQSSQQDGVKSLIEGFIHEVS